MKRAAKRSLTLLGILLLCGVGACHYLIPERFAVNAPLLALLFGHNSPPPSEAQIESRLQVPPGFSLTLYAEGISNARWLKVTPAGDLLVSQPRLGEVLLLERDRDGDGRPDGRRTLIEDLDRPHGLEIHEGWLYIGETGAIGRVRFDAVKGALDGAYEHIITGLPAGGNHWTRTVAVGPDGMLYVTVGSSCNVCIEEDERRAAMLRFRRDGSDGEVFATGLRNTVGFDWQPGTGELYGTDNGRDLLGNDFPPCELNRIVEGGFYGWPIANGDRVPDPDFGKGQAQRIRASIPPAHGFRAHNAPLGISFLRGDWLPRDYRGAALVALHGSWNRTKKDGYSVVSLHWRKDGSIDERDFIWGFEVDEDVIGRPVHVVEGLDDDIFVSDDYSGSIWRVTRGNAVALDRRMQSGALRDPLADLAPRERSALIDMGGALYERNECAKCHDPQFATPHNAVKELRGLSQRHSIEDLVKLFETPPSPMPIAEIGPEQRRALAVYVLDAYP